MLETSWSSSVFRNAAFVTVKMIILATCVSSLSPIAPSVVRNIHTHRTLNLNLHHRSHELSRKSIKSKSKSKLWSLSVSEVDSEDPIVVNGDHNLANGNNEKIISELMISEAISEPGSKMERFKAALPGITRKGKNSDNGSEEKSASLQLGDEIDRNILGSSLPSMLNMAVVPLVNSVDTFWVSRLGITLALAGQAAANQAFFSLFFLVSFLPTITAPMVAQAVGSGDMDEARDKVCEALFLANVLGAIGTIMLVGFPRTSLSLVLAQNAPAMEYAVPYLRFRSLSMIAALVSSTGFAAYRGLLNTVTPLKVSLATNLANLVADPLLIFGIPKLGFLPAIVPAVSGLGVGGAAIATAGAETMAGLIYIRLLIRKKLVKISSMFKPPSLKSLKNIVQAGSAMLLFQLTLNIAFLTAARRVQAMDPTGVSAAAYGIVMQIYSVGVVCHLGIKATAATLIPSERTRKGDDAARLMADKLFVWGSIVGVLLGSAQLALLPVLIPMYTKDAAVRSAIQIPAIISSLLHFVNGPLFAGEGVMVGLGTFKALTSCTIFGAGIMVSCICSPLGRSLNGVLMSLAAFNSCQALAMIFYHLKMGPLSRKKKKDKDSSKVLSSAALKID